ncbi:MAG: SURF1 family protein [Gemmatimonadota bacterium]
MRIDARRASFGAIAVVFATVFVRLGIWQLHRLAERRASNARIAAQLARPPLRVPAYAQGGSGPWPDADSVGWRRVELRGAYDYAHELILGARAHLGSPGVELLTPLRLEGGGAILVNRGWLRAPDGLRPHLEDGRPAGASAGQDAGSPPASVRVRGIALPGERTRRETRVETFDVSGEPHAALLRLDLKAAAAALPYPIAPYYVRATDPGPAGPGLRPLAEIELNEGPHLNYAIQWFSFALISLVGTAAYLRKTA